MSTGTSSRAARGEFVVNECPDISVQRRVHVPRDAEAAIEHLL
jgi:hypothetical protein